MEWKDISGLLNKSKALFLSNRFFKETVSGAVERVVKIKIDNKDISYNNGVIRLKTPALVKNEIFLHKKDIIDLINTNSPPNKVIDLV